MAAEKVTPLDAGIQLCNQYGDRGECADDTEMYLHCRKCIETIPDGESPASHARINVGVTSTGAIQVWCMRHDMNIAKIDVLRAIESTVAQAIMMLDTSES